MTRQKEEESMIINEVLQRLQYSPTTLICSECPDFEIEIHGKSIGVEVTKYFSDAKKKGSLIEREISALKKSGSWTKTSLQSGKVLKNEFAIQEISNKKENSSIKYKTNYFQKWLIIYAGGLGLHDMFLNYKENSLRQGKVLLKEVSDTQKEISYNLKSKYFTHIFIWDKFTEIIFQLYPYYKKIFDYGENKIWINHLPLKQLGE